MKERILSTMIGKMIMSQDILKDLDILIIEMMKKLLIIHL